MKLKHPYGWLSFTGQKRAFVVLLVLALVVMSILQVVNRPLKTGVAPAGIISFELAGRLLPAREMVESWEPQARIRAGLSLGLDYLFLVLYAGSVGLGCVLVARLFTQRNTALYSVGVLLSWGVLGAALLDSIENYALVRVLLGSAEELWPVVARWSALPKFLIVAAALGYVFIGGILVMVLKARGSRANSS